MCGHKNDFKFAEGSPPPAFKDDEPEKTLKAIDIIEFKLMR